MSNRQKRSIIIRKIKSLNISPTEIKNKLLQMQLYRICVCACICVCAQSSPTLGDTVDCGPPGSSVHGIIPARIPEWAATSSPRKSSQPCSFCTGRRVLYHWATWLVLLLLLLLSHFSRVDSVWPHTQQPTRLCCPWHSPGKNTGVSCHFLLQ